MWKSKVNVNGTAKAIILLASVTMIGLILACAPPPPIKLPPSRWNNNYSFRFDLPETKSPASVQATIAIVDPAYDKEAKARVVKKNIPLMQEFDFSKDMTLSPVAKGFARSMSVDMDKIIIAKGITVKGPYRDIEDMTFPDKKGTDLTLTPTIYLTPKIIEEGEWQFNATRKGVRDVTVELSGWIAFVMREPLTNEKIWVKKLELDTIIASNIMVAEAVWNNQAAAYAPGEIEFDGRADAMADALSQLYPVIMNKFWTYLNAEEILFLKSKTQEIRDMKRY